MIRGDVLVNEVKIPSRASVEVRCKLMTRAWEIQHVNVSSLSKIPTSNEDFFEPGEN